MASSQGDDDYINPEASQGIIRHSEEILNDPNYDFSQDGSSDYDGGSNSRSAGSETIPKRRPAFDRAETEVIEASDGDEHFRIATVLSRRHSVATAPEGGVSRVHSLVTYD